MRELAKDLLNDLNKMSMDNFDKFDYFENNVKHKIQELCDKVLDETPKVIDVNSNKDLTELEEQIGVIYNDNDVCMGELLASTGVNDISLEQATELYAILKAFYDGDTIVRFMNEVDQEDLDKLGDNEII